MRTIEALRAVAPVVSSPLADYQQPPSLAISGSADFDGARGDLASSAALATPPHSLEEVNDSLALQRATTLTTNSSITERLRLMSRWDFDVFDFSTSTGCRPLAFISYEIFERFRLFERLRLPEVIFIAFVNRIEHDYCFDLAKRNPYHTSLHAADVVQAVGHFLTVPRLSHIMDQLDLFYLAIAAIIHDFRHPGVSNDFLVKTSHVLALRYNDESVLENFHAAEAFALLSQDRYNYCRTFRRHSARWRDHQLSRRCLRPILSRYTVYSATVTSAFKS